MAAIGKCVETASNYIGTQFGKVLGATAASYLKINENNTTTQKVGKVFFTFLLTALTAYVAYIAAQSAFAAAPSVLATARSAAGSVWARMPWV